MGVSKAEHVPVNVCGSNTFGIWPKISIEETWNMYLSDGWLINYPGYKRVTSEDAIPPSPGRGLFNSIRGGFLILVSSSSVYQISNSFVPILIGKIGTISGDVYIDENLNQQICIVDGQRAYIVDYSTTPATLNPQTLTVTPPPSSPPIAPYNMIPGYVCYHNTFFLIAPNPDSSPNPSAWCAFQYTGTSTSISFVIQSFFFIQTKPDFAFAVQRLPGRGNNVLVMGSTVAEVWTQVVGIENYRRVSSFNIDNGIVSISTIASSEQFLCWLSQNENLDISIMITDGATTKRLSNDGIDYRLAQVLYPMQSSAFFYRIGGHLFYQITFSNPADNFSLIYDFNTELFFYVSDENLNFHPARQIAFYIDRTYFVSLNDGSLYQMNSNLLTYDYDTSPTSIGNEIPHIRKCKTIRKKDSDRFRAAQFTFTIEQGLVPNNAPTPARVDLSLSKNGNQSFGNVVSNQLNPDGVYRNQIRWWRLGQANELTIQLRFYGFQRFVANNGTCEIY